ncbi:GH92 family glycosyl hydrolase [Parabacteroides sp. OttesenSCG-928-G06]|nr:GH92 family glycosyl hydrolase [Parabacteroides sp. OttesenSCG-928-K15]MDL2282430.1 GH92 family glycosyl hydrolase [Parabacteroides sp. OttesenSCG-928-G06]
MKLTLRTTALLLLSALVYSGVQAQEPVDYVNPFIGTSNYGTTNPGAVCPQGMMSVTPFNVMGSKTNRFDKDSQWWSTPYSSDNKFFTGFAHVNLSGVGCPELGSLLLMPTTGDLEVNYQEYGSPYTDEKAHPGYYSNRLTKYGIQTEATASMHTGLSRFTFPKGQGNILLNLGEGLTNETGATVRMVSDTEIEGSKLLGTFCYNPQAVFRIYFVMQLNKAPRQAGYWKKQREMKGVEAAWDIHSGKYKLYTKYTREMSGDDIGVWFSYDTEENEAIEVKIGVSFVSIENARENMRSEQPEFDFNKVHTAARRMWNEDLSRIRVEGGTQDEKTIFYTGMYHLLIHPNILQDVNGEYPQMESLKTGHTTENRYTVFSLWDTYRNVSTLMTLLYPDRQEEIIRTMLDMYRENGWLPKWELYGRETFTMEGDPSIPYIVDAYMRGLRGFDVDLAYQAMRKGATTPGEFNLLRPDANDYFTLGYVPLRGKYDNSVSHALEYYIADWNLARFAEALGKKEDAKLFMDRAMGYKHYYDKEYGTLRPILPDGKFLTPFNPRQGENFEENPGFHEGSAWNYTFYVPHDIKGLVKLMGGKKKFVDKLQMVFDTGLYDPANEPDIAYAYLFSYFDDEAWRTQKLTRELLQKGYHNAPKGVPGNEDAGTMSTWAIFSMLGFYPVCPGDVNYVATSPVFDKVTIQLDPKYYKQKELVIETKRTNPDDIYIKSIKAGGKKIKGFTIPHETLVNAGTLTFELGSRP